MRAVQAYISIENRKSTAFNSEVDLAVWKLSVLRNRALGFTTVLYTRKEDVQPLRDFGIYKLYDEVHEVWDECYDQIDREKFWAAFKFIAIDHEIRRGEEFFVIDTDLCLMDDTIHEKLKSPMLDWLNAEPMSYYCSLDQISLPPGFKYPYYFSSFIRPINPAIIKCDDKELLKEWLDVAWRFMIGNKCENGSTWMVTAEQRFLANVATKYKIRRDYLCASPADNFSKSNFHIWGSKKTLNDDINLTLPWLKALGIMIWQEDESVFEEMFANPLPKFRQAMLKWDELKIPKILEKYIRD